MSNNNNNGKNMREVVHNLVNCGKNNEIGERKMNAAWFG
jgi:hypothetical protein